MRSQWWRTGSRRPWLALLAAVVLAGVVVVLVVSSRAGRHHDRSHDLAPTYGGWGTCDLRLPRPDVLPDPRIDPCAVDPGGPLLPTTGPGESPTGSH